jgi:hypothetical protein
MSLRNLSILLICGAILFAKCAKTPLAGGSDNPDFKVAGVILDSNGKPAPNTEVILVPGSYNPATDALLARPMIDTTDLLGEYRFAAGKTGAYNIQAVHLSQRTRALITGVSISTDSTRVPTAALTIPGAIKVMLPPDIDTVNGYVYVPGTILKSFIHRNTGYVLIDSVPTGVIPAIYLGTHDSAPYCFRHTITVTSSDTAITANGAWRFSMIIYLNTTSSGANVAGTVINFPVLVRLTKSNFDFNQAQAGGNDLRFTKSDNTALPYEIERWDATEGFAEVWVKIDTVYGNDSAQFISMYWGASTVGSTGSSQGSGTLAAAESNGAAVFDTSNGFQAVLHMIQSNNGKILDATANHYDGVLSSTTVNGSAIGPIGVACNFSGSSGNIQLTGTAKSNLSFPQYGTYTIAAWVYADTLFASDQHIVGKGGLQYSLRAKGSSSSPPAMFSFEEYVETPLKGLDRRLSPVALSEWKYVVAVRSGSSACLYVDGMRTDSTGIFYGDSNPGNSRDSSSDVTIGSLIGGGLHFNGSIDEVRLLSASRSPDWIKLCYMNQRPDDKLVIFR